MAKGLITRAYLEDTADAIRVLRGESDTYTPDEFGEKIIDAIPTEEVTDDIVSVTDAAAYPAEGLEFAVEPVQDLHGYDKPWPAGAYNLIPDTLRNDDGSITANGVTLTVKDGKFIFNGTATESGGRNFLKSKSFTLSAGTYYFYRGTGGTSCFVQNSSNTIIVEREGSFTLENETECNIGFNTTSEQTYTNYEFTPMISVGSTIPTTWFPYSNICPISGWTGGEVDVSGVNVWDEEWELGGLILTTGQPYYDGNRVRSVNFQMCKPNTTYYLTKDAQVLFYDASKNYISYIIGAPSGMTFTTPQNAYYFKVVETGTPTYLNDVSINYPATDTEYHAYQGISIPITFPALGKNKYVSKYGGRTNNGVTYTLNDGEVIVNGTASDISYYMSSSDEVSASYGVELGAGEWTLGATGIQGVDYTAKTSNGITLGAATNTTPLTFSLSETNVIIVNVRIYTTTTLTNQRLKIQIEQGSNATAYEPYNNTVYGGKVDVVNGKLTVEKAMVDSGNLFWNYRNDGSNLAPYFWCYTELAANFPSGNIKYAGPWATTVQNAICTGYPIVKRNITDFIDKTATFDGGNANTSQFQVKNSDYTDAQTFKTAMNGVKLVYELATPIEYDITPQQVQMLLGDNNIWCDTGDTTLEYKVDLGRYINKLNNV